MQWSPFIEWHSEYWESLQEQLKDDPPVLPKITKALPIMKWAEAFDHYLKRVHGSRSVPLTYLTRKDVAVPNTLPVLLQGLPYSAEYGSIEDELVALASHTHARYRIDNATLYHKLTEATQSTVYSASISPFEATQDGRGAYLAIMSQNTGPSKWRAEMQKHKEFLMNQ